MVSLINHEYSRREAHGRLAWQSMPSNVPHYWRALLLRASGSMRLLGGQCSLILPALECRDVIQREAKELFLTFESLWFKPFKPVALDALRIISRNCVNDTHILWRHHVELRMPARHIVQTDFEHSASGAIAH